MCGNIQPPPHIEMGQGSTKQPTPDTVCPDHHATQGFRLPGIQVIPEFITDEEEMEMVHMIEESPWKSSQSGRFKQVSSSQMITTYLYLIYFLTLNFKSCFLENLFEDTDPFHCHV